MYVHSGEVGKLRDSLACASGLYRIQNDSIVFASGLHKIKEIHSLALRACKRKKKRAEESLVGSAFLGDRHREGGLVGLEIKRPLVASGGLEEVGHLKQPGSWFGQLE